MSAPRAIDPELPWGCWLHLVDDRKGTRFLDDQGNSWSTIREAFWHGRMNVRGQLPDTDMRMMERMLAALVAIARGHEIIDPTFMDLFGGQRDFAEHYASWLVSQRLVARGASWCKVTLTSEGAAVLRMLHATRPHPIAAIRPSRASLDELVRLGRGPDLGEEGRRTVEGASAEWPASFRRDPQPRGIVLVKRDHEAAVPVRRTVWSVELDSEEQRDQLFDWLCDRLDRWEEWAKLAYTGGGDGLTRRLLALTVLTERKRLGLTYNPDR